MVQALRALACLMVVVYHAVLAGPDPGLAARWPNGSAGVDLFFVISGYIMVQSTAALAGRPGGWRIFLRRRALRIVPLYWLLTGLKLAVVMVSPGHAGSSKPTLPNVVASLLFLPSRDAAGLIRPVLPVGWTLEFEMLFYALMTLALALQAPPFRIVAPVLAALAIAAFFRTPAWPAPLLLANGMAAEFLLGMGVARLVSDRPSLPQEAGWLLLVFGAIALFGMPLAGNWRFLGWGLPAAAMLLGALSIESALGRNLPGLVVGSGDASYATYLSHPFIIPALARLSPVLLVAAVPICLVVGLIVHATVDVPLRRYVAGWIRGRGAPVDPSVSARAN